MDRDVNWEDNSSLSDDKSIARKCDGINFVDE